MLLAKHAFHEQTKLQINKFLFFFKIKCSNYEFKYFIADRYAHINRFKIAPLEQKHSRFKYQFHLESLLIDYRSFIVVYEKSWIKNICKAMNKVLYFCDMH